MSRSTTRQLFLIVASFLSVAAAPTTPPTSRPAAATFETKVAVHYLQYVPPTYDGDPDDAKTGDGHGWPLLLFLHGSGERGTDVEMVKKNGLPRYIAQGHDYPFIILSPQCEPDGYWDAQILAKLLDDVEKQFHVDPDRVYVTGLSMGGFGTWDLARRYPNRFAAIAPVCGGGDADEIMRKDTLKALPVWAFHGGDDKVVPVEPTRALITRLQASGNKNAKLTIYPGVGHDSWTKTYADPELYRWLLSHKRSPEAATRESK